MSNYELAFIGGGNMAEAIVRGVRAAGVPRAGEMIVSEPLAERRELFASLGLAVTADNRLAARSARRVLLAVKPQKMAEALADIATALSPETLIVSIAAGWSTTKIEAGLGGAAAERPLSPTLPPRGGSVRVVRAMPNTPMLVGAGMTGVVKGAAASEDDLAWTVRLFESAGRVLVLRDEALIDALTAVSGSGPAYFFYLVEQMAAAGVAEGLSESDALLLATQTLTGAAKLLAETDAGPRELRRRVTSPNGTTQAATDYLDGHNAPGILRAAVRAAATRSRELGK